jgi:predicted nicotinamide N-methyase
LFPVFVFFFSSPPEIGIKVTWPHVPPFELSTCLSQDEMAPMFHGTQWAGTRIWRAAVVAAEYLIQQQLQRPTTTTLLELGCGLGLPGILLGLLLEYHVVLTDKDSLVDQIQNNIDHLPPLRNACHASIRADRLDWSVQGVHNLLLVRTEYDNNDHHHDSSGFDIVLNCDCIYEPLYGESWRMLLECQQELLRLKPDTYMLTAVERRRLDGVDTYLQCLKDSPVVDRIEQVVVPFDHPAEVELYRIYGTMNVGIVAE